MAENSAYIAYARRPRRIDVLNGNRTSRTQASEQQRRGARTKTKTTTGTTLKLWVDDPDVKRKHRVAKYKLFAAEAKVKSSFKKGYRWIKRKCSRFVRGY